MKILKKQLLPTCLGIAICLFGFRSVGAVKNSGLFRMSLFSTPRTLDPVLISGADSAHIFHNLFRGLYIYRLKKGLTPVGAKHCEWKPFPNKMVCSLNTAHKWSDGKTVLAQDYVRAFRRLCDPKLAGREASQLAALVNYDKILRGLAPTDSLGVMAESDSRLVFDFRETDVDFLYRLASPALVPFRQVSVLDQPETWLFNGPFVLKEWKEEQYIRLEQNKDYHEKGHTQLSVEVRLVEDGTAALNLYQAKRLDFVPMIPTAQIPEWKTHADFFETSIPRFDFIGFGPALESLPRLREAITLSSDFIGFQKLFQSKTRPGCPGFPSTWSGGLVCMNDDVKKAKQILEKSKEKTPKPLTYYFTKIPTDDLIRGAEFYQHAWKRNIDLDVVLQSRELGVYRALLRENPPPIFRRGVALDRPTCLAALEMFESSNIDNTIRFQNKTYDSLIEKLRSSLDKKKSQNLCRDALKLLYKEHALIPQGEYAVGRLLHTGFKGLQFTFNGTVDLTFIRGVSN